MAFGKKKTPENETPVAGALAPDDEAGEAIDGALFAASAGAGEGSADLADAFPAGGGATAGAAPEAPALEPAPAEAPASSGDPLSGGPDLLSMFQTTQIESDDRAALLDLAGDVEIDDLLEELQTVAAAMGIRTG
jgi:hypothetical protein